MTLSHIIRPHPVPKLKPSVNLGIICWSNSVPIDTTMNKVFIQLIFLATVSSHGLQEAIFRKGNIQFSNLLGQPMTYNRKREVDQTTGLFDFNDATLSEDGRLCIIKEDTIETMSRDPLLKCDHKLTTKCHVTYLTYFHPSQEEQCDEIFNKKCQITFRKEASREIIRKCYAPLVKVCNGQGPEECRTVWESSCTGHSPQPPPALKKDRGFMS